MTLGMLKANWRERLSRTGSKGIDLYAYVFVRLTFEVSVSSHGIGWWDDMLNIKNLRKSKL
jgi:hypothetical protein